MILIRIVVALIGLALMIVPFMMIEQFIAFLPAAGIDTPELQFMFTAGFLLLWEMLGVTMLFGAIFGRRRQRIAA
ncbi:hypothetical protein SAMN06269185_1054 [Natronoarchaeum philippinense]|uniref:Uncharacterized protein n=1 Tax=Natronoarchaeum philippinense TaxID=558529 RepID=A0A285N9D2_NATPI|nr:hypothetical protein [Natronoarchaeum philippinense]SNZ06114.1 hypothetical protein SAMN06269185_1054 [Natronoarchaeum philippinense]